MEWLHSDDRWLGFGSTSVSSDDSCKQNGPSISWHLKKGEIWASKKTESEKV